MKYIGFLNTLKFTKNKMIKFYLLKQEKGLNRKLNFMQA
jgi:hypothetical protein